MKEVVNINLGGLVFSIERTAYEKLKTYLSQIEAHFKEDETGSEILEDIECSIAEKFVSLKKSLQKAVTMKDVDQAIADLGTVEDFADDGLINSEVTDSEIKTPKRLYRDKETGMIGGVASGLAQYFGMDPVIPRIVFVLLVFWGGFGILAYFVLWIIVPAAKTPAEKLAAQGKNHNLGELKLYVEEKIKAMPAKEIQSKTTLLVKAVFRLLWNLIKKIGPIIRILLGLTFVFVSSLMVFIFSTLMMAVLLGRFKISADSITLSILENLQAELPALWSLYTGFYLVVIIPTLIVFLAGISLMFKRKLINALVFGALTLTWLMALSFFVFRVVEAAPYVKKSIDKIDQSQLDNPDHVFCLYLNGVPLYADEKRYRDVDSSADLGCLEND